MFAFVVFITKCTVQIKTICATHFLKISFVCLPLFVSIHIYIYSICIGGVSFVSVTADCINGPGPARSSKIMWVDVFSWRHLVHLVLEGSSLHFFLFVMGLGIVFSFVLFY